MRTSQKITRAYVRRYSDTGQVTCYVEYSNGSRVEGSLQRFTHPHRSLPPAFGSFMHSLVQRAKREGVRLERETW